MVTGIDIVKAQIRITEGAAHRRRGPTGVPAQGRHPLNGHALQCRVTTEDPENGFTPDYGRITAYRSAAGFGIRLDAGTAYAGAVITPYYDSLLVKVTAWAPTADEAIQRMDRALREFRIRGVATNLQFLENVINHPPSAGDYTTRFIDTRPSCWPSEAARPRHASCCASSARWPSTATPEMKGRALPRCRCPSRAAALRPLAAPPARHAQLLKKLGRRFAQWMLAQKRVLLTDTTMRDAHQSLLATRMRTADMLAIAPHYARLLPQLFSLECWGGATFDVACASSRKTRGSAWRSCAPPSQRAVPDAAARLQRRRLHQLRRQRRALLRAAGGEGGHRRVPRLRLAELGRQHARGDRRGARDRRAVRGAICYTGDLFDPRGRSTT
jgi:pyruvate carboxylase